MMRGSWKLFVGGSLLALSSGALAQESAVHPNVPTNPSAETAPAPTGAAVDQVPSAQPKAAQPGDSRDAATGDIIVTAQRNRSLESRTPVSMEVYSNDALAQKGITSIQALANADTSLNITAGGGQPIITLRGVSTTDTSEVGDPAVPVAIDNFFSNRSPSLNTSLFDVSRIEVLRGPQGTLFGRNAVGGIINVYTNDPTNKLGGYVQVDGGNYGTINSTGAINVPVTDTFYARASFSTNHHRGYRDLGAAGRGDSQDNQSGRIKLLWKATDRLRFDVQYQHVNVDDTGITAEVKPYVLNPDGSLDRTVRYDSNGRSFAATFKPIQKIKDDTVHWQAAYDFDNGMSVSYIGGWDDLRRTRITPQSVPAPGPSKFPNAGFTQDETTHTLNQEIRVASNQTSRLTWQIGAFYFHEDQDLDTSLFFNYRQPTQVQFLRFLYPKVTARSIAGYGQATYALTDTLKLTGGVRYTSDLKKKVDGTNTLNLAAFFPGGPTFVSPSDGRSSSNVWTYRAGVEWQFTPRNLLYFHTDKGYKAGGYNSGLVAPYKPEILYAYELGSKNRLFNNTLTLNLAGFYQDYRNQQAFASVDPLVYGVTSLVENIGKSHIYGLEFSAVQALTVNTRIDLTGTLLHAKFKDYLTFDRVTNTPVDLSGNRLTQSPKVSIGGGIEHSFDLFEGKLTPRIDGKYQSTKYFTAFNAPDGRQKGNLVGNASIRYDDGAGRFTIEGFVRNFTNKTVLIDFTENSDSSFYGWGFAPPRTFGGRVRVNF